MKRNLLGISLLTLAGLYILLSVVIIGLFLILDLPISIGIGISIFVVIIQFLIAPWLTDLSMKWFYKAKFENNIPDYLKKFINDECEKYNMKYPKIGYIEDGAPNAFTYGRTKNDARVILTKGIFDLLTEEEVKAVVGHELGHVTHYDMLFMTVAQLVPLILYFIFQVCTESDGKRSSNNDNDPRAIIGIVAYILYIISNYIVLWLSRTREYYADEFSIKETGNPNSLASALVKIGFGLNISNGTDEKGKKIRSTKDVGALGIFDSKTSKALIVSTNNDMNNKESIKNSMKWEMWNPWAFLCELNSTHPLISKRLLNISAYSQEYHQEPYIVFDLEKPESYVDDFLLELLIQFAPFASVIITVLLVFFVDVNIPLTIGIGGLFLTIFVFLGFKRSHRTNYTDKKIKDLLGEVKVSNITSIACILEGKLIGRGDPGCIFDENFILQDDTGIIFLDYNQPLTIVNKLFALFRSKDYIDKPVKVKGWYRRFPVPMVEIYEMSVEGKTKKIYTYIVSLVFIFILLALSIFFILGGLGVI